MQQIDFIDAAEPEAPFRDIRATRPTVAEEKARLSLILHRLCASAPAAVCSGSIDATRAWVEAQKRAKKVAANPRSSTQALASAISEMQRFDQ